MKSRKYINISNRVPRDFFEEYLFILPLLVFVAIFIFLPIIGTFFTSLFKNIAFLENKFLFLGNYIALLRDSQFRQACLFTFLFTVVSVSSETILGILIAIVLNQSIPIKGFLRVSVLIPWAIPSAISGRLWKLIYNYNYGLANYLLSELQILHIPVNWLGGNISAFFAMVVADVWKTTPFAAIIILAGLQSIAPEIYNQSKIDGANSLQRFFRITLPLLKPFILVALLFRTIDALRVFDVIYVLTGGGPGGATTSVSLYAYKYFLSGDFGYGSAISVVLFIFAFLLSILYIRLIRFKNILQQ